MAGVALIFWWLWRYAEKIERLEQEEQQWLEYLNYLWTYEPANAGYYQELFESKFLR